MSLGTYVGLNYEMPQEQVTPAGYGQNQRPDVGSVPEAPQPHSFLENPQEGLQYVDNVTREYYDKYMGIRSFVDNAWKNYGIDVTKPDMSKEGAMDLHRLYQKAVADVMYTGDILKNSQSQMGKMNQGYIDGKIRPNQGFDPSAQAISTRDPRDMYTSTADSNVLQGAQSRATQPTRNKAEFQRAMERWQQGMDYFDSMIEQEPDNAEYWESQKEAMIQAKPGNELNSAELSYLKKPSGSGDDAGSTPFVSLAQRAVDIKNMSADGIEPIGVDPETGEAMMGISAFNGDVLGNYNDRAGVTRDRIIENVIATGDGKIKVQFTNQGADPEVYDNLSDYLKTYANSNFGTGGYQKLMSELKSQGYVRDDGTLDEDKLLGSNVQDPTSKRLVKLSNKEIKNNSDKIAKQVKKELESKVDKYWEENRDAWNLLGVDPLVFELPSGKTVRFKVKGTGKDAKFILDNKNEFTAEQQAQLKSLSPEQLKTFLHQTGIINERFQQELQKPAETEPEPKPNPEPGTGVVQENDSITNVGGLFN